MRRINCSSCSLCSVSCLVVSYCRRFGLHWDCPTARPKPRLAVERYSLTRSGHRNCGGNRNRRCPGMHRITLHRKWNSSWPREVPKVRRDISSLPEMVRRIAFSLRHCHSTRRRAMALLLDLRRPHPIPSSLVPRRLISFISFLFNTRVPGS